MKQVWYIAEITVIKANKIQRSKAAFLNFKKVIYFPSVDVFSDHHHYQVLF